MRPHSLECERSFLTQGLEASNNRYPTPPLSLVPGDAGNHFLLKHSKHRIIAIRPHPCRLALEMCAIISYSSNRSIEYSLSDPTPVARPWGCGQSLLPQVLEASNNRYPTPALSPVPGNVRNNFLLK